MVLKGEHMNCSICGNELTTTEDYSFSLKYPSKKICLFCSIKMKAIASDDDERRDEGKRYFDSMDNAPFDKELSKEFEDFLSDSRSFFDNEKRMLEEKEEEKEKEKLEMISEERKRESEIISINDTYEYDVVIISDLPSGGINTSEMKKILKSRARSGWRLKNSFCNEIGKEAREVGAGVFSEKVNATRTQVVMIFERLIEINDYKYENKDIQIE